ncbi:SDR family oxidoreductase [Enterobacter cloacae]|uniref:SDR family oxidoreductase n=1 Tax=Enterobacter cloacae TaxID=550 RepID=UPI0037547A30
MSYIIHGATGAQGLPLLMRLQKAGKSVIAAVRHADDREGIQTVIIDNGSVDSLVEAYRGAEGIFVHLPQTSETERERYARNIAKAIAIARPERVVISTSGVIVDEPGSPLQAPPESPVMILIDEVRKTGVSMAVVAPRLYLENLLLPSVYDGVLSDSVLRYPLRPDLAVSWSSHQDVAVVAERLLGNRTVTGTVGIGFLPGLTGSELAAGFANHLSRPVSYESVEPHNFRHLIAPVIGEAAAGSVAGFYQKLQGISANTIMLGTSAQQLLGLAPCTVEEWLAGIADSSASTQGNPG